MELNSNLGQKAMDYFKEMCGIYRESGEEEKISQYVLDFAEKHNLRSYRDEKFNVIIKKDAAGSFALKNAAPVILQAHMDMVCVSDKPYDWSNGVNPVIFQEADEDGKIIDKMRGNKDGAATSLGSDDGIGVATILAVLESETVSHPPIIALFTTQEETSMGGAEFMKLEDIQRVAGDLDLRSARFINLDEEQDGRFCTGCAGGIRANLLLPYELERMPVEQLGYFNLSVNGLLGGHSGIMIHKKRANAHRLMGRVLDHLLSSGIDVQLLRIKHDKDNEKENAIPNKANAEIAVPYRQEEVLKSSLKEIRDILYDEYNHGKEEKKEIEDIKIEAAALPDINTNFAIARDSLKKIICVLIAVPNDVLAMDVNVEDLVETSSNLGIVKHEDGVNEIRFICAVRSSVETRKRFVVKQMQYFITSLGGRLIEERDYPGWTCRKGTKLEKTFVDVYKELFNATPSVLAVHAGLECGYFVRKFGDIEMLACGPTIRDVHTINEVLYVNTVDKVTDLLAGVLESV